MLAPGCGTLAKPGVYDGDQVLYHSELSINTRYEVLHTCVTWENQNRGALAKLSFGPDLKSSADEVRKHAPDWFATAHAAHDAYKRNPSDATKEPLELALNVIRAALTEAQRYTAQAALGP